MAIGPRDAPRRPGHVVRRVLLRRNIAIDAETAQLAAAAVQAALQPGTPSRPPRRRPRVPRRLRSAVLTGTGAPDSENREAAFWSELVPDRGARGRYRLDELPDDLPVLRVVPVDLVSLEVVEVGHHSELEVPRPGRGRARRSRRAASAAAGRFALQLAATFSVHCAMTLRGGMVTIRTNRTRSERVYTQCVTHGPDGARRLQRCAPPGWRGVLMPLAHVPSLARGQVTPLVSQRGQGNARPARYGQKRCRCTRSMRAGNGPRGTTER